MQILEQNGEVVQFGSQERTQERIVDEIIDVLVLEDISIAPHMFLSLFMLCISHPAFRFARMLTPLAAAFCQALFF